VIFFILPGERVVVRDQKNGNRWPAIVLRADGTINFYEDGRLMSTDLNEFSVDAIDSEVRRKMAETINSVTIPDGFRKFAGRLRSVLRTQGTQADQESPLSEHWPFTNTLR